MTEVKAHAVLGASSAKRWLNCCGSVKLIEQAPPQRDSEHSKEGTRAHELMEVLLKSLPKKLAYEKLLQLKADYGLDMFNNVYPMYEEIKSRLKNVDELLVEARVDLDFIGPDMFGTVDASLVEHFGTLEVIDLKYGAGVIVEVEDNYQLLYYALGIAAKYDYNFTKVKMTIYQPRAFHAGGVWRTWEIDVEYLQTAIVLFKKGVQRVESGNTRLMSGDWCKFCPAAVICPEVTKNALAQAKVDFDPSHTKEKKLPTPKDLSSEQMAIIMRKLPGLEAWVSEVKAYAFDYLNRGGKIPGVKLVAKRAVKKWADIDRVTKEAKKVIGEKAFTPPELLSPAQLDKVAPKGFVQKHSVNVSSGLTIAPESDKRPHVTSVHQDFNDKPLTKELQNGGNKESIGKKGIKESSKKSTGKESGSKKGGKEKSSRKKGSSEENSEDDFGF
jgi:hypothetical protein